MEKELDERKQKILNAIIQTYLETGEPVGSRTISKYTDLNLSSATIRNEMSDLEDMGYILQPHTSAGRIPSDKGYRLYVDALMQEKEEEVSEIKELMIQKTDRMEKVLKQIVKVLASNTNYATMITGPSYHHTKVKFIQLSKVGLDQLLAVIVVDGNMVKNQMIDLEEEMDDETVLKLNLLLNTQLNGLTVEEISLGMITKMKEQAGIHSGVVSQVLDAVAAAISEEDEMPVFTSGATNILKYPELSDGEMATQLISAFEEKKPLAELLQETKGENGEETGIQIYIGSESPIKTMKDCSVVTATYELGDGMTGTIGIIGPKRMDYENVVDNLKTLKAQLDSIFKKE
ncbi:MAG: heat-inducible transcriptional repressor HrcA [Ruminococcus sp.]|jgi:heat-inducible transcriptional repressor